MSEAWDYLRENFKPDGKGRYKTSDAMKVAEKFAADKQILSLEIQILRERLNLWALLAMDQEGDHDDD